MTIEDTNKKEVMASTEEKKVIATIRDYQNAPLFTCKTCSRPGNPRILSWNDCDRESLGDGRVVLFCPDYEKSSGKGCGNQLGIYSLENPVDVSKIKKI